MIEVAQQKRSYERRYLSRPVEPGVRREIKKLRKAGVSVRRICELHDLSARDAELICRGLGSMSGWGDQDAAFECGELIPREDKVLVFPFVSEAVTQGGIHLPEQARRKRHDATVFAAGPMCRCVEAGMNVIVLEGPSTKVKVDGRDCVLVNEEDVVAELT